MKRALALMTGMALIACAGTVVTSQKDVKVNGNMVHISSGTQATGRFVKVDHGQKPWEGEFKGGKNKWGARRDMLELTARNEIERICHEWFVTIHKGPIYNMLDNDETMGGVAPVLGIAVSMAAYLAAEAATKETNIPSSVYIEFSCTSDENKR